MTTKRIVLLNASPRKKGTSRSFGESLKELIEAKGHQVEILDMIDYFDEKKPLSQMKLAIEQSDSVGILIACYISTLPYPAIDCLEKLAKDHQGAFKGKAFFAIAQGGMPYADVHEPCITTSQCFAQSTQMNWLGGCVCGLGPMINGARLEEVGSRGKKIMKAFGILVEDILEERSISPRVQQCLDIRIPSLFNYPLAIFLNYMAKKDRVAHQIADFDRKPYL